MWASLSGTTFKVSFFPIVSVKVLVICILKLLLKRSCCYSMCSSTHSVVCWSISECTWTLLWFLSLKTINKSIGFKKQFSNFMDSLTEACFFIPRFMDKFKFVACQDVTHAHSFCNTLISQLYVEMSQWIQSTDSADLQWSLKTYSLKTYDLLWASRNPFIFVSIFSADPKLHGISDIEINGGTRPQ